MIYINFVDKEIMASENNTAAKFQTNIFSFPETKDAVSLKEKAKLYLSLDRLGGERKPYILRSEGAIEVELKLSSIRAAIFLVLLLDLQDRLDGGSGINDILEKVIEFYCELDPAAKNTGNLKSVVRVGLYRFEFFLEEVHELRQSGFSLFFKSAKPSLEIKAESFSGSEVILTSTDQAILRLLEKASKISPLARLRKYKSMYVPAGEGGWDQLFLEFFDHKHKVRNTSLFYRFALPTYPYSLLKSIGASEPTMKRKALMLKGYESKRVESLEIISRETLWDSITYTDNGNFKLYPGEVSTAQVKEHLENIIFQLKSFETYNLVLTSAPFPFILSVVEIINGHSSEAYTLFYRQYLKESTLDTTCFALNNPATNQSVQDQIIGSVLQHPSTLHKRNEVIAEVSQVLQHLNEKGPIELKKG